MSLKIQFDKDFYEKIAQEFGTPTYIYSEAILKRQCRRLKAAFSGMPVNFLYAIKANSNPHLVSTIVKEGFGLDTVSTEEVELGLRLGVQPKDIFYTENNITDQEALQALQENVYLNIGSSERFLWFCEHNPGGHCSIRLKPDIGDGHHKSVVTGGKESKFGIQLDLVEEILDVAKQRNVTISGIHIHIGSGIKDADSMLDAVKRLLKISHLFPDLQRINFGGGFPIPYKPNEPEFNLEELAEKLRPILEEEHQLRPNIVFFFEPGRLLTAQSGELLTRVMTVKQQGSKIFVGTDTGFNHLMRPAMYNAYHHVSNVTNKSSSTEVYTVSGNICESGDILAEERTMGITQSGDLLVLSDTGAYGMSMASQYNLRRFPAEVLVEESGKIKLIRRRKNLRESVDEFLKDTLYT